MDEIDMVGISEIARRVVEQKGPSAMAGWKPSLLDTLNAEIHHAVHQKYPVLDPLVGFRVASGTQMTPGGPWQFRVFITRDIGTFVVPVPDTGTFVVPVPDTARTPV